MNGRPLQQASGIFNRNAPSPWLIAPLIAGEIGKERSGHERRIRLVAAQEGSGITRKLPEEGLAYRKPTITCLEPEVPASVVSPSNNDSDKCRE